MRWRARLAWACAGAAAILGALVAWSQVMPLASVASLQGRAPDAAHGAYLAMLGLSAITARARLPSPQAAPSALAMPAFGWRYSDARSQRWRASSATLGGTGPRLLPLTRWRASGR